MIKKFKINCSSKMFAAVPVPVFLSLLCERLAVVHLSRIIYQTTNGRVKYLW
jgi:hypothetical protein